MSMSQVEFMIHMFCAYAKHKVCRRIFARLAAKSIHDCAVFSMFRSSCAYARLQYFALAVSLLATTLAK